MIVSVWAPRAGRSVEVLVDGGEQRVALAPGEHGRWAGDVPGLGPGGDYALSIDGGPARPDPRSAHQPHGVDGPSRVVDHAAFPWTDDRWAGFDLPSAVLYELHVGTFSPEGTFDGAIARLDHLVDLGVDAVELLPVVEFPGRRGWGYDGVDLWAPHDAYGGPDGLKRLVDACHARGLGVVLDVVYNHLGPAGNHLAEFGPYFADLHPTNWGPGINVDGPGSDEVRAFVVDNARMWLADYHADGLRLDAVHAIADESATHVLEQLATTVRTLAGEVGRPLWLLPESDLNAPRFVRPPEHGGYGLDASWADEWHHALHAVLTGEASGYYHDFGPIELLAKALRQAWVYDGVYSPHRDRVHGRAPTGLHGRQFVVCAQNHDQVGNRARGDRLGHLVSPGRVRTAAALLLMSPFVPLLFQGEEWAASTPFQYFTDHRDPDLGRAVSDGRRREFATFGWAPEEVPDPQDPATFAASVLRWDEVDEPGHADVLAWYRSLIALRRQRPGLATGPLDDVAVAFDEDARWLTVHRIAAGVTVAVNLATEPQDVPVPTDPGRVLLAGPGDADTGVVGGAVRLPSDGVAVLAAT
ncbi:MAG TPA: malto-oligosyltrehalose trehalohydrolase [Acidimicrobiales bacterium]|nr:malto-oligosyltrehalose trehalohydrolase [Acidimicrobiales bacterium]